MLSRWAGKMIDRYGNGPFIRFSPLLTLSSVVLFALFASVSYIAVLFVYMLMSVGFTLLMSSISNEMSRMLPASQIGSGLGLYQLLQFFSGAFGAAAAASALVWQLKFSLSFAYGTIFWGMAFIVLAAIGCAHLYLRDLRDRGSDRSGAASQGII
jgi:DHA2 family metal-tetracycline-proton antiporter-like MFS transporter